MSRVVATRKFIIVLLTTALLGGFVNPQVGDQVELASFLYGRSSANFEAGQRENIETVLKPGTLGKIVEIRAFKSGNFGLFIDTEVAGKKEKVWIHYDPRRPYVTLCENSEGSCKKAESLDDAQRVRTEAQVKALRPLPEEKKPLQSEDVQAITQQMKETQAILNPAPAQCNTPSLDPEAERMRLERMHLLALQANALATSHPDRRHPRCAAGVKRAMVAANIITPDERWNVVRGNGEHIAPGLEKTGKFVKLPIGPNHLPFGWSSLNDAPPGTVLTYDSRFNPTAGHVEVRTHEGFASDFKSPYAITGPEGEWKGHGHVFKAAYVPL